MSIGKGGEPVVATTRRLQLAGLVAVTLLIAAPMIRAGTVQTMDQRLQGRVTLSGDGVDIDGREIRWSETYCVLQDAPARTFPRPHLLRLHHGEVLCGELSGLSSGRFTLRSDLFGEASLDARLVALVRFVSRPAKLPEEKPRTLYRKQGEPVPGALVWIDQGRLGLESPLGTVSVNQEDVVQYVYADPPQPPRTKAAYDEIALVDGSVLHGRLVAGNEELQLEHDVLGQLPLPDRLIRSVVRHRENIIDLSALKPTSVVTAPLIEAVPVQSTIQRIAGEAGKDPDDEFVTGLRLMPKTTVRFALPTVAEGGYILRAGVKSGPGGRGDVQIRVLAGTKLVFDQQIEPGKEAHWLEVRLPVAGELVVEVDFGRRIRFPAVLDLIDPHLVLRRQTVLGGP
jgi:hypothetical protein